MKIHHGLDTSSIRDKWHRWKSRTKSEGRYFSSIVAHRIGWKVVVWLHGLLLLSAKRPWPPGRQENSERKTIWRTTQRANNNFWSNGWISSVFTERSDEKSSIWQESISWNLSLLWVSRRREFAKEREIYARRINAKEVLIRQKTKMNFFSFADGTAKLSERDHDFCRESEDLNGELHGEPGESQPTEHTDDAEARADSSQRTSSSTERPEGRNVLHSTEIHWCYKGLLLRIWTSWKRYVLMTTGMSIRTEVCQFLGKNSQISHHPKGNLQRNTRGPARHWQRFKQLPDQTMYGQKSGRKLAMPLRIEKNQNGQKKNQSSTMLEDWEEFALSIQSTKSTEKFSKSRGETGKTYGRRHAV